MNMFNREDLNPIQKTAIILFSIAASFIIGQFITGILSFSLDASLFSDLSKLTSEDTGRINTLKFLQFISAIFTFVLPSVVIAKILDKDMFNYLQLRKSPQIQYYLLIVVFMLSVMPAMNIIVQWNESISLPNSLSDIEGIMRQMEDSSQNMVEIILSGTGFTNLAINIIVIAVLPAIGEEFLFRGVIQKHLTEWTKNPHIAIFVAAFLFSAIHFQFYGFIPRLLLGMTFGYMYYYSKSLWTAIFAHFFNNALAIVGFTMAKTSEIGEQVETFGTNPSDIYFVIGGVAIAFFVGRGLFWKRAQKALDE